MNSVIIETKNLHKHFKGVNAVNDLSFTVKKGEVHGFLGQNGAGKSTTIRMLLSLIAPTSGQVSLFGKDLIKHRNEVLKKVGAIIEKPDLYNYLSAEQNIKILAALSRYKASAQQVKKSLEMVGLGERAKSKVKTFSQGMKQRLGIACALIHEPELIILDEPVNGLDPQGIADIRNLILHLSRNEGKTVLISSHLLSEVELIADSMLIIDKGRKVAEGKVSQLLNPADTVVEVNTSDNRNALLLLQQSLWGQHIQTGNNKLLLHLHKNKIPELNRTMVELGIEVLSIQPKHSLEDFFLSLTTANEHVATYKN